MWWRPPTSAWKRAPRRLWRRASCHSRTRPYPPKPATARRQSTPMLRGGNALEKDAGKT
ncbi:TPA: hypothetical protein ACTXAV_002396 [Raoultella planticola]|uniref:hypothetical protein n=1 Tax=Raoultella planticola TaxID=575 RepID=UPI001561E0CE|nr:hypothetical protein [Raoultella planticola]HED2622299.1 hypothetical protein [Raoultella planticola]HEH6361327.1 hypothetical protein [Raoultella planticola]